MKKQEQQNATENTKDIETKKKTTRKSSKKKKDDIKNQFEVYLLTIQKLIGEKKNQEAEHIIALAEEQVQKAIENINELNKGKYVSICFFYSLMETSLYSEYFDDENRSDIILLPYDYVSLLSLKGQLAFLNGDTLKAQACLHEATKYNPVCVDLLFLCADINHNQFNWFSYMMDLDRIYTFIHKEADFKKYYRYLAVYYNDYEKNISLAKILNDLGNEKDETPIYQKYHLLTDKKKKMLEEHKIPHDISSVVLNTLVKSCSIASEAKAMPQFKYFYNLLLNFRSESEIKILLYQAD